MQKYFMLPICAIFILLLNGLTALEKRPCPISLTASIIIPCHAKHARYLPNLLDVYAAQTTLADEVVISLGPIDQISHPLLKELKRAHRWPFPVKLICSEEALAPGDNRNRACKEAKGDIFICQDADDIPHFRRVEIIKFFFENYPIDHLMHTYTFNILELPQINELSQVEWFVPKDYDINLGANGVASLMRRVFEVIQWDSSFHGEDVYFNETVYRNFENRIVIKTPLYYYNH